MIATGFKNSSTNNNSPKSIPTHLVNQFTLNGYSTLINSYMNDATHVNNPIFFAKSHVDNSIKQSPVPVNYPKTGGYSINYAIAKYRLDDLSGIVIGSLSPWVEAICLRYGARKVITVDYQKINTDDDRLGFIHAINLAKSYSDSDAKYDFAASFSSIEHSGLGRYGDPLDPIGDLREMEKVACLLKSGGRFYVGVPVGADVVVFNLHRMYGNIRLPMMFAGWKLLDIFDSSPNATNISEDILSINDGAAAYHFTFVLEKI